MPIVAPALFLALSLSPSAPSAPVSGTLMEEALAVTEAPARFRVQPPAGALVGIADGNGDGAADVVVAASRTRGAWLLPGDGKGALGAIERLDAPMGAHGVGDLDADGAPEQLLGGAFGTETVLVQGKPGPASPALAADLDGDGTADLARLEGDTLRIGEASLGVGPDVVSLAAADLDRDGSLDLLVADAHADQVSVFLGDGQGRFRAAGGYRVWLRPFSLATGDLNADGAADLVVSDQCGSTLAVLHGNGNGGFSDPVLVTQPSGPNGRAENGRAPTTVLKSLILSPTTVHRGSGSSSTATVQLERPAPPEGMKVRLASSDPSLVESDQQVLIPEGETSVTVPITTLLGGRRGRLSYRATLTATVEGGSASATLTVTPE